MADPPRMSGQARGAWPLLAIAALAVSVALTDGLWRWLATAALLVATGELAGTLTALLARAPAPLRTWVRTRAPVLVLVAIATVLLWPLVCGEPPASRDHAIHYFQARILVDEMIPSGRLSGWTDRLNHGFPYGEGYPTLGYLWVSALHLLSFGAIDLRASYAWGLLGVWSLSLWGVWRIAAWVTRDVLDRWHGEADDDARRRTAAWAGCVAALAWLLDPGAARQGGWNYLMFHGVWPQLLSVALWIASLVAIAWSVRAPSLRRIAVAAMLVAGGLLAHPFGLLTTACSALSFAIVLAVAADARTRPGGLRVLLAIHALGIALAFAGLATFLAAAGEMGRSPVAWSELGELAAKLATGDLFGGTWAFAGAFAMVGLALALWSGRTVAWVCASTAIGMLVLASQDAITVLRLDLLTAAFKNLQFPRFAIALKPFVFAFAGTGLVVLVHAAWSSWAARIVGSTRTQRVFVAIVLAPVLGAMLGRLDALARRPIGAIDTLANSGHADDELALREALLAEAAETPALRVAFLRSGMGGGTYPLFAIADAGGAAVLDGHVPTVNFVYNVERRSTPVLRRLGVTHVVHDRPLGDEESALASRLVTVGEFGPYTLSRLDLQSQSGPQLTRGTGTFEVIESGPQSLVLDVDTAGAELSLSRAPSERWQWTLDGEPLDPMIASVAGGGIDLLAVELTHGGRLELGWTMGRIERRAPWVSGVAALLVVLALGSGRPLSPRAWAHDRRARTTLQLTLAAIAALLVFGVVRRQHQQLATTWDEYAAERAYRRDPRATPFELVDDLTLTGEIVVEPTARRMCDGLLGRDVLDDCEEGDHVAHPSFTFIEPYIFRCTSFGVPPRDTVTVRLGAPGDEVLAFVQGPRSETIRRDLRWSSGGAFAVLGGRRADVYLRPKHHPEGAVLQLSNDGDDLEDVCIGAARVR